MCSKVFPQEFTYEEHQITFGTSIHSSIVCNLIIPWSWSPLAEVIIKIKKNRHNHTNEK